MITQKNILLLASALFIFISSCNVKEDHSIISYDNDAGLSRADFKENLINPEIRAKQIVQTKPKSKLLPILSTPEKPKLAQGKLISLKITDNIPLKDIFIELGRVTDIEMQIDPNITGGTILIVKDRPFLEVVAQICNNADLRYITKNGILRIERDLPYIVNYSLPYINTERSYTSVINASSSGGGDKITSGGNSALTISSTGNLWSEITSSLQQMVSGDNVGEYISINKKSGIITISTSQKNHINIKAYLDKIKREAFAQVLIEAKIVEVQLKDEYHTGIKWSDIGGLSSADNFSAGSLPGSSGALSFITVPFSKNQDDFSGTLNFIQSFGTTRTLSSPRLTATNNQQAMLTFTENKVYFEISYEGQTSSGGEDSAVSSTTISSEIKTVPLGIILSLQPSINLDKQEVLMNIRPTISSSNESIKDPGVEFIRAQISKDNSEAGNLDYSSEIPIIKTQELDTLLKAKSGQVMVIGGLIEQRYQNNEIGIPFIKNIPIIGNFFKSTDKKTILTETLIFIKASIINQDYKVINADQNFYNKFTNDPHPLKFN